MGSRYEGHFDTYSTFYPPEVKYHLSGFYTTPALLSSVFHIYVKWILEPRWPSRKRVISWFLISSSETELDSFTLLPILRVPWHNVAQRWFVLNFSQRSPELVSRAKTITVLYIISHSRDIAYDPSHSFTTVAVFVSWKRLQGWIAIHSGVYLNRKNTLHNDNQQDHLRCFKYKESIFYTINMVFDILWDPPPSPIRQVTKHSSI